MERIQCSARNEAYHNYQPLYGIQPRSGLSPSLSSSVYALTSKFNQLNYSYSIMQGHLFFAVHVRGGVTVSKKEGGSGKINVQYPKRLLRIHESREGFKAELCADTILPPYCAEYLSDSFHLPRKLQ